MILPVPCNKWCLPVTGKRNWRGNWEKENGGELQSLPCLRGPWPPCCVILRPPGPHRRPSVLGYLGAGVPRGSPTAAGGEILFTIPPSFLPSCPPFSPPPSLSFLSYDFVRCSPKVEYRQSSLSVAMHKLKPFVTGVFLLPSQGREGPSFVARRRWIINWRFHCTISILILPKIFFLYLVFQNFL